MLLNKKLVKSDRGIKYQFDSINSEPLKLRLQNWFFYVLWFCIGHGTRLLSYGFCVPYVYSNINCVEWPSACLIFYCSIIFTLVVSGVEVCRVEYQRIFHTSNLITNLNFWVLLKYITKIVHNSFLCSLVKSSINQPTTL